MGTIECNIGDIPSNYKEINCSKDTSDNIRAFMCKPGFKRKQGDDSIIINNVSTADPCNYSSPSLMCEPLPYKLPNIIRPDKSEHFQCSVTDLSASTKENIKTCFKKNIDTEYSKLRNECNAMTMNGCSFQRYKGDYLKKKEVIPDTGGNNTVTTTELISFEEGNKLFPQAINSTRVCWENSSLPELSNNNIQRGTPTSATNSGSTCITLEHLTYNNNLPTTMNTNKSKIERGQNIEISNTTDNFYIGYEISDKSNNKFIGTTVYDTLHKIDPTDSTYNYYPGSTPPSPLSDFRYNCSSKSYFNGYNVGSSVSDNSMVSNPSNLELYGCEMNTCFNDKNNDDDRFRTIFNYLSTNPSTGYNCQNSDSTSFFTCAGDKERFGIYHDNDCTSSTVTTTNNLPTNDISQLQCNYCDSIDSAEECDNNNKCYWYQSAGESLSKCKNKCEARTTLGECEQFYKENNESLSDTLYNFDGRDNSCIWIPSYFNNDRSYSSKDGTCRDIDSPCFPSTSVPESSPCEITIPSKDIPLQGTSHNGFCYLNESEMDRYLTDPYCGENYINKNEEICILKEYDYCNTPECTPIYKEFKCISDGEPYIDGDNKKVYTTDKECSDIKDKDTCNSKNGCISIPSQKICEAKSIRELIEDKTQKYDTLKDICKPLKAQVPVNYDPNLLEEEGLDLASFTEKHNVDPPFLTSRYLCDVCTIRDKDINYIKANPTDPHYNINADEEDFNEKDYCEKPIDKYDAIHQRRPCKWLEGTGCMSRCKIPLATLPNPTLSIENMEIAKQTCSNTLQFSDEPLYRSEFPNLQNGKEIEDDYYRDMYCTWDGFECHNSIPCKDAQRTRCEDLGYNWYVGTAEDIVDQEENNNKNPDVLSSKFPVKHKGDGKPIMGDSQGICVFPNTKAVFVGASAEYTLRNEFRGHQGILLRWKEFGTDWTKDNSLRRRVNGGSITSVTEKAINFSDINDITMGETYRDSTDATTDIYLGDNLIFIPFEIDGGETATEIKDKINLKLRSYEYFSVNGDYVVYAKTIYDWALKNYKDIWYNTGNGDNADINSHPPFRKNRNNDTGDISTTTAQIDSNTSDNVSLNSLIYHYGGYLYYKYGNVKGKESPSDTLEALRNDHKGWDSTNKQPHDDVMMANVIYDLRGIINLLPVIDNHCVLEINEYRIEADSGNIKFKMYPKGIQPDNDSTFNFKTYQRFQFQEFMGHEIIKSDGSLDQDKLSLKKNNGNAILETYRKKKLDTNNLISNNYDYGIANLYEPFINEDRPIVKIGNINMSNINKDEIEEGYRKMSVEYDKWETNKKDFSLNGRYFVTVDGRADDRIYRLCKCSGSYEEHNYYNYENVNLVDIQLNDHPLFKLLQYYNKSYSTSSAAGSNVPESLTEDIIPTDIRRACLWSMCRPVHPAFGNLIYDPSKPSSINLIKSDSNIQFKSSGLPYTYKQLPFEFNAEGDQIPENYYKHLLDPFRNNNINATYISGNRISGMIRWSNLLRYLGKNYNKIVLYKNLPNPIPSNGWSDTTNSSWHDRINSEGSGKVLSNNNSSTYYDKLYVTYIDLTPFDVTTALPTINTNAFIHISDASPVPTNYEQYFYPGKWVNPPTDTSWPTETSSPGGYGDWDEITTPSGKLKGETNKELQRLKQLFGNSSTVPTLQPIPSILGDLDTGKFITSPDGTGISTSNDILGRKQGELLTETQKKAWPKKGDLIDECDALNKYMDIQDDFILTRVRPGSTTRSWLENNGRVAAAGSGTGYWNNDAVITPHDDGLVCDTVSENCGDIFGDYYGGCDSWSLGPCAINPHNEKSGADGWTTNPALKTSDGYETFYEHMVWFAQQEDADPDRMFWRLGSTACTYSVRDCFHGSNPRTYNNSSLDTKNYKIGTSIKNTVPTSSFDNKGSGDLWSSRESIIKPNNGVTYTFAHPDLTGIVGTVDSFPAGEGNNRVPYNLLSRLYNGSTYVYSTYSNGLKYYRDGNNTDQTFVIDGMSNDEINLLKSGTGLGVINSNNEITGGSIVSKWSSPRPGGCGIPIPKLISDNPEYNQVYFPESPPVPSSKSIPYGSTPQLDGKFYNSNNTNTTYTKMPIGYPINEDLGFSAEPNNNSNYYSEQNDPGYPNWLSVNTDGNTQLTPEQCYNLLAYVPNDSSNTITNVSLDNCSLPLIGGSGNFTGDISTNNISMFENNVIPNKTIRDVCHTVCQTGIGRPKSGDSSEPSIYEYTVIPSQSKYVPSENTHALFVIPTQSPGRTASQNPIINAKSDNTYYISFDIYYENKIFPGYNHKPLKNLITQKGQEAPFKTFYLISPSSPALCPRPNTIPSCIPDPSNNNMFSTDELVKDIDDFTCKRELLNVIQSDCLDKKDADEFTICLTDNANVQRLCSVSDKDKLGRIGDNFEKDKNKLEPWLHLTEEQEPANYSGSIKSSALSDENNPYNINNNCEPSMPRLSSLSNIEFKKIRQVDEYEIFKPRYGSNGVSRIFKNISSEETYEYGCIRGDIMNVEEDFFDLSCNTNTIYNIERNKFVLINAIIEESIKSTGDGPKLNSSDRTKLVLMNEEELLNKASSLGLDINKLNEYTKPKLVTKVKDIYDSHEGKFEMWDDLEQKYLSIDNNNISIPSNIPKLGVKEWEFVGCGLDHNNIDSSSSFRICKDKYPGLCQKNESLCRSTNPRIKEAIMLDCPETCQVQFSSLNSFEQNQVGDLSVCSQHGRCKWSRDQDPANLLPPCDESSARTYGDNDKCQNYESLTIGSCVADNNSPHCRREKCESMQGCEFTEEISKTCLISNRRRDDLTAASCNHHGGRWTGQTDDIGSCLIPKYYDSTLSREQCNALAGTYIEDKPASCIYNSQNWLPIEDPCSMPHNINLNLMSDQELDEYQNKLNESISILEVEPECIGSESEISDCTQGNTHPGGIKLKCQGNQLKEGDYIHITSNDLGEQCSVYLVGYSKILKKEDNHILIKGPSQSYTLEQDPFNPSKYNIGNCIIDKAFTIDSQVIDSTIDITEEYDKIKDESNKCIDPNAKHGGSCTYIYSDDPGIISGSCKSCSLIKNRDECVDKNITSTCGWGEIRDICESIGNIGECNDMYVDGCYWDKEKEMCLLNQKRKEEGCIKCGDIKHYHTCNSISNCFFNKELLDADGNGVCQSCYEYDQTIDKSATPTANPACAISSDNPDNKTEGKCQWSKGDSDLFRCRPTEPYPFIYEWIWYNKFLLLSIWVVLYAWWKIPLDKFNGVMKIVMGTLKGMLIFVLIPILFVIPGITPADGENGRKYYVNPPINPDKPGYLDFLRSSPDMKGAIWPATFYDNRWDDKIMDNTALRNMIDLEIWPNSLNWSEYLFWKPIRAWNRLVNSNQNNEVIIIPLFILAVFIILLLLGTSELNRENIMKLKEKSNPKNTYSIIITVLFMFLYINYLRKTYHKSIYDFDRSNYTEKISSSNPTELNKTTNLVKYYGRQEVLPDKHSIFNAFYTTPTEDNDGNSIHVCPVGCRLHVSNDLSVPQPTNTTLTIGDTLYEIFPTPVDFPACGDTTSLFSLGGDGHLTESLDPNAKVKIDHYDHSEPSSISNWIVYQGDTGVNYICPKEQKRYKWPYDEICLDTRNQCKATSYNIDKPSPSMNQSFTGRSQRFIDQANEICDDYHKKYNVCETYDRSEFKDDLVINDDSINRLAPPYENDDGSLLQKELRINCNTVPKDNVDNCPFPENTVYFDYYGDVQRQPIKLWKDTYNYYFGPTPHRRLSKSEKVSWQNEERYEIVDQNYMVDRRN